MNQASSRVATAEALLSGGPEGVRFDLQRHVALSAPYGALFAAVADAGAAQLRERGLPAAAAAVLAREALISPAAVYMDRLLRLESAAAARPGELAVPRAPSAAAPSRAETLRSLAHDDPAFNDALLARLGGVLGLESRSAPQSPSRPRPPRPNTNFQPAGWGQKAARVLRSAAGAARAAASRRRPLPALSMGYATRALKDAGFYPGLLRDVQRRASLTDGRADAAWRRGIAESPALKEAARRFLSQAGGDARARVCDDFASWLAEAAPSALWEAAPANLAAAAAVLEPFGRSPLLVGETCTLEPTTFIAAAKSQGRLAVGAQHGGHYGYMRDHVMAVEFEYAQLDAFVTWGWDRLHGSPYQPRLLPAPYPWLEERRRLWSAEAARDGASKPDDALLMTNQVYRFPPAPCGAARPSSDHRAAAAAALRGLAQEARTRGLRLRHKPYDAASAERLDAAGACDASAGALRPSEEDAKGLPAGEVALCRAVVWDQPGTGFLECLAAGLPTIAWWPRVYNLEEPGAAADFAALEETGLLHSDAQGLCDELLRLRSDPGAWMAQPRRRRAAAEFSRRWGRSDPDWAASWKTLLEDLAR